MALDQHLSDFPPCASIPHAILNAQLVFCPHDGGYTLSLHLGDTSDRTWSSATYRYGPFDDINDVASDLAKYLAVVARRRLLEVALREHEARDNGELSLGD